MFNKVIICRIFFLVLAKIRVNGIVQGVGFRPFVYRIASHLELKGYVLNLGDAGVEIEVEGDEKKIEKFIELLKEKKPPLAVIEEVKMKVSSDRGYKKFEIRKSKEEKEEGVSAIPPDIAICDECLRDMERQERRKNYFFTTCTNCGPRFTIIRKLPYDRHNTTMDEFEMCDECYKEYTNPLNRRYHAQTIACRNCGPKIFLLNGGKIMEGEKAIWQCADLLNDGKIVAIKGIGGYHLACIAKERNVKKLRKLLGRPQKPFALMVKDIEMAESIAYVSDEERKILESYIKPIVLLEKKKELPYVAPGLHNYGIMLPYTGLHYLLFKRISYPLIMTSANLPGKPIIKDEEEVKKIGADYILFYNREIHSRCDDSIIKFIGQKPILIRRSRGYVPSPVVLSSINLSLHTKNILALGAEENVTACLLKDNHAFLSQYIGNVKHYETYEFLKDAVQHLINLLNFKADAIACDLHPNFLTTRYAEELAEKEEIPLHRIQHHHAHVAKAMAEYGLKEAIGIAIDGFGYGEDGMAWGGEVLYCRLSGYERLGHLQNHIMPGGDMAAKYPLRMLAGILGEEIIDFLYERKHAFPHGEKEIEVLLKQLRQIKQTRKGIRTSSCGRLLDAISALLDICHLRNYEGEPAMKLESVARKGKDILELEPIIKNGIIDTKYLLIQILENMRYRKEDLAYSAEEYIANSLAQLAIEKAEEKGVKNIVIAGGCAYNEHIVARIEEKVRQEGYLFFINQKLPCGDGGISFGQAVVAGERVNERTT